MPNLTLPLEIKTEADARQFFEYLVKVDELNFHPDTDMVQYLTAEDGEILFDAVEAKQRNSLMNECFDVLDERVYDVALEVLQANN